MPAHEQHTMQAPPDPSMIPSHSLLSIPRFKNHETAVRQSEHREQANLGEKEVEGA